MANKRDTDLFQALRAAGLRKKLAHAVTDASRKTGAGKRPKLLVTTMENLKTVAADIERRADGKKRSKATKKATQTGNRNAARSVAARKTAKARTDTGA
jgi:hypothetical protein